jgi:hypothetical protein
VWDHRLSVFDLTVPRIILVGEAAVCCRFCGGVHHGADYSHFGMGLHPHWVLVVLAEHGFSQVLATIRIPAG